MQQTPDPSRNPHLYAATTTRGRNGGATSQSRDSCPTRRLQDSGRFAVQRRSAALCVLRSLLEPTLAPEPPPQHQQPPDRAGTAAPPPRSRDSCRLDAARHGSAALCVQRSACSERPTSTAGAAQQTDDPSRQRGASIALQTLRSDSTAARHDSAELPRRATSLLDFPPRTSGTAPASRNCDATIAFRRLRSGQEAARHDSASHAWCDQFGRVYPSEPLHSTSEPESRRHHCSSQTPGWTQELQDTTPPSHALRDQFCSSFPPPGARAQHQRAGTATPPLLSRDSGRTRRLQDTTPPHYASSDQLLELPPRGRRLSTSEPEPRRHHCAPDTRVGLNGLQDTTPAS
jgi:hypothetical protein